MMNVEIRRGKHSTRVPKGMDNLIAKYLRRFVPKGKYLVNLGAQIRGSGHKQGEARALRIEGDLVTLAVQPGSKDTRFEVHVVLKGLNAQEIFDRMIKTNGSQPVQKPAKNVREILPKKTPVIPIKQIPVVPVEKVTAIPMKKADEVVVPAKPGEPIILIETSAVQEARAMKEEKTGYAPEKVRLDIGKLLADHDWLLLLMMMLSEQQEKTGCINAKACNVQLLKNGLVDASYSKKATSRIFPALARMEYLVIADSKGCYVISEKGRELLATLQVSPAPPLAPTVQAAAGGLAAAGPASKLPAGSLSTAGQDNPNPAINEIDKDKQLGHNLIDALSEAKKELAATIILVNEAANKLAALHENERQAKERVDGIKAKIKVDLDL